VVVVNYRVLLDGVFLVLVRINVVSSFVLILLRFLIGLVGFHYGLIRGSR
jgi:hypothetical protein